MLFRSPLGSYDHLDQYGKEEQQALVRGGKVDAAVEAHQEHALDEQGGEDYPVGDAHPQPDGPAREGARGDGQNRPRAGASEQPQQQHLPQEQVPPAGRRAHRLGQHVHLEAGDGHHEDAREGEDRHDPHLVPEDVGLGEGAAVARFENVRFRGGRRGGGGRRRRGRPLRDEEEFGAEVDPPLEGEAGVLGVGADADVADARVEVPPDFLREVRPLVRHDRLHQVAELHFGRVGAHAVGFAARTGLSTRCCFIVEGASRTGPRVSFLRRRLVT